MEPTERTQSFLESTADVAVIHTTPDGTIAAWLGAAESVLGYTPQEAVGMPLSTFFTEEDRRRGLDVHEIAVALEQGSSEDDRWHVRKDGSRFWANGVLSAVRGRDGSVIGLCKVLRDRTDLRTRVLALENMVERLKAELDAERKAISTVAHELRNPLMPIVAALDLLQRPGAEHMAAKAIRILVNQVGLFKRLLDDLNSASQDPSASLQLRIQPVNLNAELRLIFDGLREAGQSREQRLSLVMPRTDIWVAADPARLQQMLLNLLGNALKYTPAQGRIDVSATIEGNMGVVRIEDDGAGISAEVLPEIFELFTREGRQPSIEGKGVGLAVVKQLAMAHGGFVEARSGGRDKGASFGLRLPLAETVPNHQDGGSTVDARG